MKTSIRNTTIFALIAIAFTFSTAVNAQVRAYRVTDREVQTVLDRIESRTNELKIEVERNLDNSTYNGTTREESINTLMANFEAATDRLRDNFRYRRSTTADVENVLTPAVRVNAFMENNRLSLTAESLWTQIRADLTTIAGYYQVTTSWNTNTGGGWQNGQGQGGGYTVGDAQVRIILDRIKLSNNNFRRSFTTWNRRFNRNGDNTAADDVLDATLELNDAIVELRANFNRRNSPGVDEILRTATPINTFVGSNRTSTDVMNKWVLVRNDLNTLASYSRVSWDWNNPNNNNPGGNNGGTFGSFDTRLTGTYRLNVGMSDNVSTVVDRAIRTAGYNANVQDRMRRNLERRLAAPETLSFEKRGRQVTMSSANAASVVLNADGTKQTETSPNGRTVTTIVTATNTDLTINYEGDRMNDFYVSFAPAANNQLKVTRRIYLENQNTTVTTTSVYDKTSQTPDFNLAIVPPVVTGGTVNGFIIPNNTGLVATLDAPLSTRTVRDGDRFSMTVTSPSQYNGAVIEGNLYAQKSGVVSGRATMSMSFDTIRLRNGQTYKFAGIVDQVQDVDGRLITVNNEGTVQDNSRTGTTVARAGIGAVLGAIIGAIAGGGDGAAIGAGVGAGAGVGTVVLQGRDNLELATGSRFSITATAPANVSSR